MFYAVFSLLDRALMWAECLFYSVCNQRASCSAAAMAWQQQWNDSLKVTTAERGVVRQEDRSPPENTVGRSVAAVQASSAIHYLVCWRSRILQNPAITLEFPLGFYPNFAKVVTSRKYFRRDVVRKKKMSGQIAFLVKMMTYYLTKRISVAAADY